MNLLPARTTDFLIQFNVLLKYSLSALLNLLSLLKWVISAGGRGCYSHKQTHVICSLLFLRHICSCPTNSKMSRYSSTRTGHTGFEKYVYPHEQPEQGSTNFQEIRYEEASLKFVDTVQFWLKQDNYGQFQENPT